MKAEIYQFFNHCFFIVSILNTPHHRPTRKMAGSANFYDLRLLEEAQQQILELTSAA
jgi:hypothetical protein